MAWIDLGEQVAHGYGADSLQDGLDTPIDPARQAEVLRERILFRVPEDAHYLGTDEFSELVGTATTEQVDAMRLHLRQLDEQIVAPAAGTLAIAS